MPGEVTRGWLLDGRVRHDQFSTGFRSGIEPVLLAASVPARAGDQVLEAGSGAGAGLLCLAWRTPGVSGVGLERDPSQAALATSNAGSAAIRFVVGDIRRAPLQDGSFDHAFANPPYHAARLGPPSPDPSRRSAKVAGDGELAEWIGAMARLTRRGGTVTLSVPAARIPECLTAFSESELGSVTVFPLWPRADVAPKLVLLRGIRDGRAAFRISPGLILHGPRGELSAAAETILRHGSSLSLSSD